VKKLFQFLTGLQIIKSPHETKTKLTLKVHSYRNKICCTFR